MSSFNLPPTSSPHEPAPVEAPPARSPGAIVGMVLLLLAMGVAVGYLVSSVMFQKSSPLLDPNAEARPVVPRGDLMGDERATIDLFRKSSDSVVYITTVALRRDGFNINPVEIPRGTGSGFVWDDQGHIVTNYHVVASAVNGRGRGERIRVTLADQTSHDAQFIGGAPDNDLAVLRIETPARALAPLPLGSSSDLQVGQKVLAIGNPFGLDQTLTTGVISGLGREISSENGRTIFDVIQTDAAINPGNSGGPLLDSAGRLIGVNTAIYSPSGAYAGIGFAIPVDTVNRVVPQLLRSGGIVRPGFGVQIANDQITKQLGLEGVLILRVEPGGAAHAAKLQATLVDAEQNIRLGDVIVAIDDVPIRRSDDLFKLLERREVGDEVSVSVIRNARSSQESREKVEVTLKALPQQAL